MDANEFFEMKVKRARQFGFPDPIFINAEQLTGRSRVVYLVEVQSTLIPDLKKGKTHHYSLKFSKFKKVAEEPFWIEEDLIPKGFSIADRQSIEKLYGYIASNQKLLEIDVLTKDFKRAFFTNSESAIELLKEILALDGNREEYFRLFKEHYPKLNKKLLVYRLVQARREALEEFKRSLKDPAKTERNYWQKFLTDNKWMFGLPYFVLLDERRLDISSTADYLFESEDGFIDIVEIKNPHDEFWLKKADGTYVKYRNYLQVSNELRGAVTQGTNYIFEVEKKCDSAQWMTQHNCQAPVKPKCLVVLGRSADWQLEEGTAFRLLNDSLHGVSVITFDHLRSRAEKALLDLEQEH